MSTQKRNKKLFSLSNIITALLALFAAGMLFFPNFKATVLQGLMKVGLFQPGVHSTAHTPATELSWDVTFTNSKGETLNSKALKGKVVFINFWATWCPPCIAEMPSVNQLFKKYQSNPDIVFLLVDADNKLSKSEKFMADRGFGLPVYALQGQMPYEWFEGTLPTTVVLDKKGNIVFRETGVANYASTNFMNFIDRLLKE